MKIPDEVLDEHREINVHDKWWENVYDEFREDMGNIGIDVDRIYFSGFWSQGDGACFEGSIDSWEAFLPTIGYNHPVLIAHALAYWTWRTQHRGNYYHANSVNHDDETEEPYGFCNDEAFVHYYSPYPENDLRSTAWLAVLKTFDYDQIRSDIKEALTDHMNDLYKRLENEYEYLTSDEAVAETIMANDLYEEK